MSAGLCQCGCGERTSLATQSRSSRGVKIGDPNRFKRGHHPVPSLADRIAGRHVVDDRGCWIWQGAMGLNGYGVVQNSKRRLFAHRVAYEVHVGPIPNGLVIDHLCRVTRCVNPTHLEPVIQRTNARRGAKTILTFEQAKYAARMRGVLTAPQVAAELDGVGEHAVRAIWRGRTWRDATAEVAAEGFAS